MGFAQDVADCIVILGKENHVNKAQDSSQMIAWRRIFTCIPNWASTRKP